MRSVFISMFSPLKPVLVTGLCCMDTGNVGGPGCVSRMFPAGCGAQGPSPLPWLWENPFPSSIDPAEPHLGFSHFPEGQARCSRRLGVNTDPWSSSSSSSLWPGNVRGSRSSPSWEMCPGQEEKGAGSGWWESHPAAPGSQGCPGWGSLPTTSFFLSFFTALKRQPGILLNPIPTSLQEDPVGWF